MRETIKQVFSLLWFLLIIGMLAFGGYFPAATLLGGWYHGVLAHADERPLAQLNRLGIGLSICSFFFAAPELIGIRRLFKY